MKQVVQNLRSGAIGVEEVPAPSAAHGLGAPGVLVATACSLISPGTERAAVELGKSSLIGKAWQRPDQVKKVLANLRRDGFSATYRKVQQRLDASRAMGYSCAGTVLEARQCDIAPGTRVACVGTDAATHAEVNFVPRNFVAAIPESVSFEEAAFAALGGIALHSMHLSNAAPGEHVAVLGLGPVGLLLAQVLRASGCRVCGFELREDRMNMARQLGFEHVAHADSETLNDTLHAWGIHRGFARVFIAAASKSAAPVEWGVEAAADRATLVIVGDVRTDLPRNECYAKELSVVYARSYGPGRYDPAYEEAGEDFPVAQERWSLRRNLEAFLEMLARKQIATAPLITHRFAVDDAARAYEVVTNRSMASLGVLLEYTKPKRNPETSMHLAPLPARRTGTIGIGVIGAGAYAQAYLLPALKADARVRLVTLANAHGISAKTAAKEFGFARCATDANAVLRDAEIDAVFIATRHDLHARLVCAAIEAGNKFVFVEKPLCITEEELRALAEMVRTHPVTCAIGFNRRFAPATQAVVEFFDASKGLRPTPLKIEYIVHSGRLPEGHWLRNPAQGGRIAGEVCHFVDWCNYLAGSPLKKITSTIGGDWANPELEATLEFTSGATAALRYDSQEPAARPKETIRVSSGGRTASLEDFVRATFASPDGQRTGRHRGKGQTEMVAAFLDGCEVPPAILDFEAWSASTLATLKLLESASTGLPVQLDSRS